MEQEVWNEQSSGKGIKTLTSKDSKPKVIIGLYLPREGHIESYRRYLKQFGTVAMVTSDYIPDKLDLFVIPDLQMDTTSHAFSTSHSYGEDGWEVLSPAYSNIYNYIIDRLIEEGIPVLGIGNGALLLATKFKCKLHSHVPNHFDSWHFVRDTRNLYNISVRSMHFHGISDYGETLEPLASAVGKNSNLPYMLEAFRVKGVQASGIMWNPHEKSNPLDSEDYRINKKVWGDPISHKIVTDLINKRSNG